MEEAVAARSLLSSLLLSTAAAMILMLLLMLCLWRKKRRTKMESKSESLPESPVQQSTEVTNVVYDENDEQTSYNVNVEEVKEEEAADYKVEMRNNPKDTTKNTRRNPTDSPSLTGSKSPNTRSVFNKMFKSKKYLDVEPAPDYLTSRRDTLQNDRNWHRKYSAQWHDFVENELFNTPAQDKNQSQLQLVENPA